MKRYMDYEKAELAGFDDARVKQLIELEVAYAGVLPVPEPEPVELEEVKIEATDVAYQVYDVLFEKLEDAIQVSGMKVLASSYDYAGAGYDYKYLEPHEYGKASEKLFFYKKDDIEAVKGILTENSRRKAEHEAQDNEYQRYKNATQKIYSSVWAAVAESKEQQREIAHAITIYAKHTELADQDEKIANKFFCDAYKHRADIIEAVLGKEFVSEDCKTEPVL